MGWGLLALGAAQAAEVEVLVLDQTFRDEPGCTLADLQRQVARDASA